MRATLILMGTVAMTICLTATAWAEDPPAPNGFGSPGQVALDVDVPFQNEASQLAIVHSSVSMGGTTENIISIQPSLDYFVAPHVSVGGLLGYTRGSVDLAQSGLGGSGTVTELAAGARVGYDIPLTGLLSLWARIELVYVHVSTSGGTAGASGYAIPLIINVPLLIHPAPHFFLGAGPVFETELVSKQASQDTAKSTHYGIQGVIGGYFGGA